MGAGAGCSRKLPVADQPCQAVPHGPASPGTSARSGNPGPHARAAEGEHDFPYSSGEEEDLDAADEASSGSEDGTVGAQGSHCVGDANGSKGLVWHVQIVGDDFNDPKHCTADGELKPHRPMPHVRLSRLKDNLVERNGCWIYDGCLNSWPALADLELCSLTARVSGKLGPPKIRRLWDVRRNDQYPALHEVLNDLETKMPQSLRARFVAPAWTLKGWSPSSPGFAFWFAPELLERPCFFHGEDMIPAFLRHSKTQEAQAVQAHVVAHRYSVEKETYKDRLTWHTLVLLEWTHGRFVTVVELAWLNGMGGYGGKSNWCRDRDSKPPEMYRLMPEAMKGPWMSKRAEARLIDMPLKGKDEFQAYLEEYSTKGPLPKREQRFFEPRFVASEPVRLAHRSQSDIARYMLNYIGRRGHYDEVKCNCQTFTADFFGFLAGRKDVRPFSEFIRVHYKPRPYLFLYDPDAFG